MEEMAGGMFDTRALYSFLSCTSISPQLLTCQLSIHSGEWSNWKITSTSQHGRECLCHLDGLPWYWPL